MSGSTQLQSRGIEPVARCLIHHLMVPDVYFEVRLPGRRERADLLLIDMAGAGDVHVVKVRYGLDRAMAAIGSLMRFPAHYRWIACYADRIPAQARGRLRRGGGLYPSAGAGRVGVIEIDRSEQDDLTAAVLVKAERFLSPIDRDLIRAVAEEREPDIRFD